MENTGTENNFGIGICLQTSLNIQPQKCTAVWADILGCVTEKFPVMWQSGQGSEVDRMVSCYNRSTIPSMDHFSREHCLLLFIIFDLDTFTGYC